MKKLLISSLLLIVMLTICIVNIKTVDNISKKSIEYIDKMNELNLNVEDNELNDVYSKFKEYWDKKSNMLSTVIYHEPLDEITEQISKLSVALKYNEKYKISESLNAVKTKMTSLSEDNSFSLQNLL